MACSWPWFPFCWPDLTEAASTHIISKGCLHQKFQPLFFLRRVALLPAYHDHSPLRLFVRHSACSSRLNTGTAMLMAVRSRIRSTVHKSNAAQTIMTMSIFQNQQYPTITTFEFCCCTNVVVCRFMCDSLTSTFSTHIICRLDLCHHARMNYAPAYILFLSAVTQLWSSSGRFRTADLSIALFTSIHTIPGNRSCMCHHPSPRAPYRKRLQQSQNMSLPVGSLQPD